MRTRTRVDIYDADEMSYAPAQGRIVITAGNADDEFEIVLERDCEIVLAAQLCANLLRACRGIAPSDETTTRTLAKVQLAAVRSLVDEALEELRDADRCTCTLGYVNTDRGRRAELVSTNGPCPVHAEVTP